MSFLNLENKNILVFGAANRKSIAYKVGKLLEAEGAKVFYSVRSQKRKEELSEHLKGNKIFVCDVSSKESIDSLTLEVAQEGVKLDGILHSIAYANYSEGVKPFHETKIEDFEEAMKISAFSLVEISRAFKGMLNKDASVVSVSISSQVLAKNYGYMSPIKSMLESCSRFLAKSFSEDSRVRFNTINSGPLKTSASAGIPGYLENYLYAEKMTLRKEALKTEEVANTALFLLSERSSGINAQNIVVNAGMDLNYFDEELVTKVTDCAK